MDVRSELDPPFSQPGSTATDWSAVQRILEEAETSWLTTVHADGRPHVTPLVAVWHGDSVYFCTGEAEQKAVNLRSNQHVGVDDGMQRLAGGDRRGGRRRRHPGHRRRIAR